MTVAVCTLPRVPLLLPNQLSQWARANLSSCASQHAAPGTMGVHVTSRKTGKSCQSIQRVLALCHAKQMHRVHIASKRRLANHNKHQKYQNQTGHQNPKRPAATFPTSNAFPAGTSSFAPSAQAQATPLATRRADGSRMPRGIRNLIARERVRHSEGEFVLRVRHECV